MTVQGVVERSISDVDVLIYWSYESEKPSRSFYVDKVLLRSPDADVWDLLGKERRDSLLQSIRNKVLEEL